MEYPFPTSDVRTCWVYPPTPSEVWTFRVYSFSSLQRYKSAGCIFLLLCAMFLLECRTVRHPACPELELIKMLMPGAVRYRNKGIQSGTGMLRYRTEMSDAGMPMPAALVSMPLPAALVSPPMPSYDRNTSLYTVTKCMSPVQSRKFMQNFC